MKRIHRFEKETFSKIKSFPRTDKKKSIIHIFLCENNTLRIEFFFESMPMTICTFQGSQSNSKKRRFGLNSAHRLDNNIDKIKRSWPTPPNSRSARYKRIKTLEALRG